MVRQELKIPDHFINRTAERDLFQELLQFNSEARLLAIADKKETGKSTLLKMLRHQAFFLYKKPVGMISLEEPAINSSFVFIERLRKDFGKKGNFANFDAHNLARVSRIPLSLAPYPMSVSGTVDARQAVISGANPEIVGTKVSTSGTVIVNPSDWTSDQEDLARDKCIQGFFLDLKASDETMVILLDAYEQCNTDLQKWIEEDFLLPLCTADDRPTHLILVLAGRELPSFQAMLGQEQYEQFVRSRELSMWEEEHVKDFLKVHGYDLSADDVDIVWRKVKQGTSIGNALILANTLIQLRS